MNAHGRIAPLRPLGPLFHGPLAPEKSPGSCCAKGYSRRRLKPSPSRFACRLYESRTVPCYRTGTDRLLSRSLGSHRAHRPGAYFLAKLWVHMGALGLRQSPASCVFSFAQSCSSLRGRVLASLRAAPTPFRLCAPERCLPSCPSGTPAGLRPRASGLAPESLDSLKAAEPPLRMAALVCLQGAKCLQWFAGGVSRGVR